MVQPEYKSKKGQVQATVWANEKDGKDGKKFTSYSVQLKKSYTTDEGKTWNKSNSYFAQDIQDLTDAVADVKKYLEGKKVKIAKDRTAKAWKWALG